VVRGIKTGEFFGGEERLGKGLLECLCVSCLDAPEPLTPMTRTQIADPPPVQYATTRARQGSTGLTTSCQPFKAQQQQRFGGLQWGRVGIKMFWTAIEIAGGMGILWSILCLGGLNQVPSDHEEEREDGPGRQEGSKGDVKGC
jgi:hypothetical protein